MRVQREKSLFCTIRRNFFRKKHCQALCAQKNSQAMYIDIFLIVLILWAAYSGWRNGFLKEVVSAGGFFVGLLIAATCYSTLGDYLTKAGSQLGVLTNIVAFFLLWIIVPIALGFVANVLTKALKGLKLGLPNSLLGVAVSVLKYAILISCVFNVMSALHIMNEERTRDSRLFEPAKNALSFVFSNFEGIQASQADDEQQSDTIWVDFDRSKK